MRMDIISSREIHALGANEFNQMEGYTWQIEVRVTDLDFVYISFQEPNKEQNWADLKEQGAMGETC